MATDILQEIESLNSQSFSDYQHLIFDLKEVINKYNADTKHNLIKDRNLKTYEFRNKSTDYTTKVYNKKLDEFVNNFFSEDELIREVISNNPDILRKISVYSSNYFWPIMLNSISDGGGPNPNNVMYGSYRANNFNSKYKSDYFLQPKPVSTKPKEGCFIATFAFESYDHNHVLMLRNYRDAHLSQHLLGRNFIKYYYRFSPSLIKLFKIVKFPKIIIRRALNIYLSFLRFILQKKI